MGGGDLQPDEQASAPVEVLNTEDSGQCESRMDQTPVLLDLLKQVPPLLSENPEDILSFFIRLGEIHSLDLVEDRRFITRIFPLVPRGLLQFLAECMRDKNSWATCKARVLEEYFPCFIRERLVRNLIVFNFHGSGQSVRTYIDRVIHAAEFLQYEASEQQLVERIMNFHPDILKNLYSSINRVRVKNSLV
jgi:hypothetical protein